MLQAYTHQLVEEFYNFYFVSISTKKVISEKLEIRFDNPI